MAKRGGAKIGVRERSVARAAAVVMIAAAMSAAADRPACAATSSAVLPIRAREAVLASGGVRWPGRKPFWGTARNGRLYEIDFSANAACREGGIVSRSESLAALGRSIARPDRAATSPTKSRVSVRIKWNPATPPAARRLWAIYLYTRAALVAAESEEVSLPPGRHIPSFNEELRGRLMAVYLYRQMHRKSPGFHSAYFAALSRVQAAGFLREYVWHYLKEPAWRRPRGLQLAAFKAWRAVHLRHHVPQTYGWIDIVPLAAPSVADR